jgi:spore coat protein U-like protein
MRGEGAVRRRAGSGGRLLWRASSPFALLLLSLVIPADARAASCSVSATPIAFGIYDVFRTTPTDGVGTITVSCNQSWVIARISLSTGQSGTYAARLMRGAGDVLRYNLYRNAHRTTVWGDGTGTTSVAYVLGPTAALNVYGRIPSDQDPAAGTYADNVTVSIDY